MTPTLHARTRAIPVDETPSIARLSNGAELLIRPATPRDVEREAAFLARLPPECRSYRFLGLIRQNGDAASTLSTVDPVREVSLIGLVRHDGREIEVGAARFRTDASNLRCDCAIAVDPCWQDVGVGGALMRQLIAAARRRGVRRMYAVDPARCSHPHWLASHLGFRARLDPEDPNVITYELVLDA